LAEKSKKLLDERDWRILKELQQNARVAYAELSRRVNLSTPAVIERIHRMEDLGIIEGYRTEVSCARVGYPIMAFVSVSVVGNYLSRITRVMSEMSEVTECYRITGADSFLLKVCVTSVDHLQEVIDRFTPYVATTTSIVLSTAVKRRSPDYEKTA
jgi:Lrp/AsnC family leucine-responsive transcriptional regulator